MSGFYRRPVEVACALQINAHNTISRIESVLDTESSLYELNTVVLN